MDRTYIFQLIIALLLSFVNSDPSVTNNVLGSATKRFLRSPKTATIANEERGETQALLLNHEYLRFGPTNAKSPAFINQGLLQIKEPAAIQADIGQQQFLNMIREGKSVDSILTILPKVDKLFAEPKTLAMLDKYIEMLNTDKITQKDTLLNALARVYGQETMRKSLRKYCESFRTTAKTISHAYASDFEKKMKSILALDIEMYNLVKYIKKYNTNSAGKKIKMPEIHYETYLVAIENLKSTTLLDRLLDILAKSDLEIGIVHQLLNAGSKKTKFLYHDYLTRKPPPIDTVR